MEVYFVRHGETEYGRKLRHQTPATPLSDRGREDSYRIAEELRDFKPDCIVSSEYTRALETARIIGLRLGLNPQLTGLFHEVVRPSSLFGKHHFSPKTFWYVLCSALKRDNRNWRYGDAENYADLSDRVIRARTYLETLSQSHERVVVVSHSMFITIMSSFLVTGRMLSVKDLLLTLLHIERLGNGGIIHLTYNKNAQEWKMGGKKDKRA